MKYLRKLYARIKNFYSGRPKLALLSSLVLFFIVLCVVEIVRSSWYVHSTTSYKNSATVLEMRDTIDKVSRSVNLKESSYLCDISLENLVPQTDQTNTEFFQENNHLQTLVPKVQTQITQLRPAPKFYSFVGFLPQVAKAKKQSYELERARANIIELTKPDARSDYCTALETTLIKVYFITTLQKPEGVEALFPGQLENFQVVARQAQEAAQKLTYPTEYEQEHVAINKLLVQIEKDLKANSSKSVEFSRRIAVDVQLLNDELDKLQQKAEELSRLPTELKIYAEDFVNK